MADPVPEAVIAVARSGGWPVCDFDPVILHIHGDIAIRWYGVAYLLGLVFGWWLLERWARRAWVPLRPGEAQDFVVWCGLGMILGGRLGYCLFYEPHLFGFTAEAPWWGVLAVHHGGMASHGGIIGLMLGCWWWGRRRGREFLALADLIAATGPLGIALGRAANFINGELPGRPTEVAWAWIFPNAPLVNGLPVPRHPSQLYALVLEGLLPLLILLWVQSRHRRPGLTGALFFLLYGTGRFIGEFFREPDVGQPGSAGHAFILGFMTKGQAYTLPALGLGLFLLWWSLRRPPRPEAYRLPTTAPAAGATPAAGTPSAG